MTTQLIKSRGFVIKGTYLTGQHTGETFTLLRGGYVSSERGYEWEDDIYKTRGIAQMVCTKMQKQNASDHEWAKKKREWDIAHGNEPMDLLGYELQSYEPYEVDVIGVKD